MNKKVLIIALAVIAVIVVLVCFVKNDENINNPNNNLNNNVEENSATKMITDDFVANITDESDHYVLTVQTNIIEEPFKFSYNSNEFSLDTSSALFDSAVSNQDGDMINYSLELKSNKVYKLYFIKKNNVKLEFEKKLIIE